MKIAVASDHGGLELKKELLNFLSNNLGLEVEDLGTYSTDSVDYPDFAHKVAEKVESGQVERGLLVCGSGIGMCMAANRHRGIRAVVLETDYDAKMSRLHNNANVACLGGRVISSDLARELLTIWFSTEFEGDRHIKRIEKIELKN